MLFKELSLLILCLGAVSACGGGKNSEHVDQQSRWYRPAPSVTWQWQLQGTLNTHYDVELYDIDLFDSNQALIDSLHTQKKKVICYFSAGSYENWRDDANQFKSNELGKSLDGWEGERWLDTRSTNVRKIMQLRLDLAKSKHCDGVEPDNMDGYQNKAGFPLNEETQLDFNRFIATQAHARGLSVGLKNDLGQIKALLDDFDFAVNEQCFEYSECELLSPFIKQGKAVLNAEYQSRYVNDSNARKALCKASSTLEFSTLVLPLKLDDSFRNSCL